MANIIVSLQRWRIVLLFTLSSSNGFNKIEWNEQFSTTIMIERQNSNMASNVTHPCVMNASSYHKHIEKLIVLIWLVVELDFTIDGLTDWLTDWLTEWLFQLATSTMQTIWHHSSMVSVNGRFMRFTLQFGQSIIGQCPPIVDSIEWTHTHTLTHSNLTFVQDYYFWSIYIKNEGSKSIVSVHCMVPTRRDELVIKLV